MRDGEIRPTQCKVNEETGERKAKVLPDEFPGEDRIPEQLMYVPPEGFIPENMDDPDVPLKTIVLWNGVGSWGGLRPGRGVFLKEKCPVSSCVISSNRIDGPKADLVIFKVSILLFLLPDNTHLTEACYNFGYCIFSRITSACLHFRGLRTNFGCCISSSVRYILRCSNRNTFLIGRLLIEKTQPLLLHMKGGSITMIM